MIFFKQKIYRGENWIPIIRFSEIEQWERSGRRILYLISERKSFKDDYKKIQSYPNIRKRIKDLRKDLREGYIYDDRQPDSNTHWIGEEKDLNKKHYMSKDIDDHNRLTYDIFHPFEEIIDDIPTLIVPISLVFCTDHKYRDTRKTYSLT